jgi:aspartate kinase
MSRIVQKFGGTSVADIARLERVALTVRKSIEQGHQIAVVVSGPDHDTVYAAGEQITCGLLAIALGQIGIPARAFLGWQVPIVTDETYTNSEIIHVDPTNLLECMKEGVTPVIAGFQGVTPSGRVTTLGRGGSDTTAVSIAAAIKADWCDIYTDVTGVFTADPRIVPNARKLKQISYDEMFELASLGAKVLQKTSVDLARRHSVNVRVLSSFVDEPGTDLICESGIKKPTPVCGITHSCDEAKLTLLNAPISPKATQDLSSILTGAGLDPGQLIATDLPNRSEISVMLPKGEIPRAIGLLDPLKDIIPFHDIVIETNLAKMSVIGSGIKSNNGVATTLLETLYNKKIPLQVVAYAPLKLSVFVPEAIAEEAVRALHNAYGLDKE